MVKLLTGKYMGNCCAGRIGKALDHPYARFRYLGVWSTLLQLQYSFHSVVNPCCGANLAAGF